MYIACRRLEGAVGEVAVSSGAVAAAAVSVVAGPREWDGKLEAYAGRQAMIKTSRTRQSFPPLYESERWLNLCVDFRVSQCVLLCRYVFSCRPALTSAHCRVSPTHTGAAPPLPHPLTL